MDKWSICCFVLVVCVLAGASAPPHEAKAIPKPSEIYTKTFQSVVGIRAYGPLGERKGTGIILDTLGHILASATTVTAGKSAFDGGIEVFLNGSVKRTGTIVGRMTAREIVIIRIDPMGLKLIPIEFGRSSVLAIGDTAYTLGNASNSIMYSDQPAFSIGIISGMYQLYKTRKSSSYKGLVLETSAAVNTGMEGAGLLNREGKLVGMITPNYSSKRWMGNAIPIDEISKDIELLRTGKHASQLKETVNIDTVDANREAVLGITVKLQEGKIVVFDVLTQSAAWKKGIRQGDVIVGLTSKHISTVEEFNAISSSLKQGDVIWLEVDFDGEVDRIQITLSGGSK